LRDYGIVAATAAVVVVVGLGQGVERSGLVGQRMRTRFEVASCGCCVGVVVERGVEDWFATRGRRRLLRM